MKKIITIIIVINLFNHQTLLLADNHPLFREIIKENSRIVSIDSEIVQYINTNGQTIEKFSGRYRAVQGGRFRIDYSEPYKQTVLNNGRSLYWYYPDINTLYEIGKDSAVKEPKFNPLQEYMKNDKKLNVLYLGRTLYGFFNLVHFFIIKDGRRGLIVEVRVDSKKNVILEKIVKDKNGFEIIKEIYGGYELIQDIYFPSRVDVYAKTANGFTRNTTHYNNARLNTDIAENIFELILPKNVKRKVLEY
jgi:outer membrane lipoprotein-sorting protein